MLPFSLGEVSFTLPAMAAVLAAGQRPEQLLVRHMYADWGELDADDWERDNQALASGMRLLSAYKLRDQTRVWVITEADRSATTVMLPEEY